MCRQCAINSIRSGVSARRPRRTLYVCDSFDPSVRCKLGCKEGLSAELVGTGEQSSGSRRVIVFGDRFGHIVLTVEILYFKFL